jgi:hypothetical protein
MQNSVCDIAAKVLLERRIFKVYVNKKPYVLLFEPSRAVWAKDDKSNIFVVTADTRSAKLSENLRENLLKLNK